MAEHNKLGREGEVIAVNYLKRKGYAVRALNWRHRQYELDIVAQTENELVIVEVKTRSVNYLVSPEDAVSSQKIRHLVAGADAYVKINDIAFPVRFDVLTVVIGRGRHTIDHIEDAFFPPLF